MKELVVVDYGYSGEGICKDNGKVFFVPKTITGEKVSVKVIKENSKFCFCSINEICSASPNRKSAPCPYFDKCGGCNFQHMSYCDEISLKKNLFLREISKILDIKDVEIVKCENEYGYRNKVRFKVKNKSLGFYEEKTNNFIKIENCLICNKHINSTISKVNAFLKNTSASFDEVIIFSFGEKLLIDFVTKEKVDKTLFCDFDFPVVLNHDGQTSTQFMKLKYDFKGDSFRQVNDTVAEKLYSEVLANVNGKTVINAYSGAGVLSGLLAQKAKKVYGIELNKYAHASAESLKIQNNISNLTNICGYAEQEILKIKNAEIVVFDPPRAGCDKKMLQTLLNRDIKDIIYISCNPATLVRDLGVLKEKFAIEKIKLFDMFPRTANVETIAILKRNCLTN